MTTSLKIDCYAKINLFLSLLKKRSDSYHEIQSVFQSISLYDSLVLKKSKIFSLKLNQKASSFPIKNKEEFLNHNLIQQIYDYFLKTYHINAVKVSLIKRIPIGAGLGGGSADGAGMIWGINQLFDLNLSLKKLIGIASYFGSDIPFALKGGCALVKGRGEKICFLPSVVSCYVLLIYPEVFISTKTAYKDYVILDKKKKAKPFIKIFFDTKKKNFFREAALKAYNGFESKTFLKWQIIHKLFQSLKKHASFVRMSGSGSSLFALFLDKKQAESAFLFFKKKYFYTFLLKTENQGIRVKPIV